MANEKRLIDATPLAKNGWHLVRTGESNRFLAQMSLADVPTVDAVEVVRCKDCQLSKYYEESGNWHCRSQKGLYRIVDPNEFCSWGDRADGGSYG